MMTEDDFLDFTCPNCSEPVSFPGDTAGLAQECPNCNESLIVPQDGGKVGRKLPFPLTGPKLVLRRLQAGDWKDVLELMSDEELFTHTDGRPMSEEEVLRWLEADSHMRLTTANQPFYLGVVTREGSKLIGYVRLSFLDLSRRQVALHVLLSRSHQRQGLGTETMGLMLDFCFRGIRLHRLTALCEGKNIAACRLLEKVGMRREGEFLKDHQVSGEWLDTIQYALLEEEYERSRQAGAQGAPA